jgi:hypothetical protein
MALSTEPHLMGTGSWLGLYLGATDGGAVLSSRVEERRIALIAAAT